MIELRIRNEKRRVEKVRKLMLSAGNRFADVWFLKRENNELRRMTYRLNIKNPSYVKLPNGKGKVDLKKHQLMNVLDCNVVRYNDCGRMSGRTGWKSIPLNRVIRVSVNGVIYRFR